MNEITIFNNPEFGELRTTEINGEPWFVGKDVAEALGYTNTRDAISKHVDEADKASVAIHDGSQNRTMAAINESGVYSLIFGSKLEGAKRFKHWVTSDVLPTIRRHGAYMTDAKAAEVVAGGGLADLLIQAGEQLKQKDIVINDLRLENAGQRQIIGELQPKASYYDTILQNKSLVTITQIAKDYGMSGKAMNKQLNSLGVQYQQSGQWFLYSKYHNKGYTSSETVEINHNDGTCGVRMYTKWTQKGRLFLYELLKQNGVLPTIERA